MNYYVFHTVYNATVTEVNVDSLPNNIDLLEIEVTNSLLRTYVNVIIILMLNLFMTQIKVCYCQWYKVLSGNTGSKSF